MAERVTAGLSQDHEEKVLMVANLITKPGTGLTLKKLLRAKLRLRVTLESGSMGAPVAVATLELVDDDD